MVSTCPTIFLGTAAITGCDTAVVVVSVVVGVVFFLGLNSRELRLSLADFGTVWYSVVRFGEL